MEKQVQEYQKEQLTYTDKVRAIVIKSNEDCQLATDFGVKLKTRMEEIDKTRKFFTDPLNTQLKNINGKFKPIIEAYESLIKALKSKTGEWIVAQEQERLKLEEELRQKQEKQYQKDLAKAEKKGEEAPPPPAPITIEKTKIEGTSARVENDFEVIDPTKVPYEFNGVVLMIPDDKAIRKLVKAGVKSIAGIRIFPKVITSLRKQRGDDDL